MPGDEVPTSPIDENHMIGNKKMMKQQPQISIQLKLNSIPSYFNCPVFPSYKLINQILVVRNSELNNHRTLVDFREILFN